MDICIVGGGASGLMTASLLDKTEHNVTLIEKNDKLGKKIYITGKGRCNFTNSCSVDEFIKNVVTNPKFLYSAINICTPDDVISFFEERGMATKKERGNRMFPLSDKSNDVIKALSKFSRCKVMLSTTVKDITIEDGKVVGVVTDRGNISCDVLVLATGGVSYPSTGSTGDGYRLLSKLSHSIIEPKPALVPLFSNDSICKRLEGLSLKNVSVTAFVDNKEACSEFGEMLFTAQGVSGPCILTISSKICRKNLSNCYISIDLKPAISEDTLITRLKRDFIENNNKFFKNSLGELLPKSLIPIIVEKSGINPDKKVNQITVEERLNLARLIKDFRLKITSLAPFSQAVITSGGVSVKEINPRTMESKIVKGLYVVGELLDVDAFTGGYNLQIAFSTASCAVNAIIGG